MLHPRLGLGVVAGAHVDDVFQFRIAQEAGAGECAHERHLRGGGDRLGCGRSGCTHRADQREHFVFLDQLLGRRDRAVRLIAVVHADQLELAAMHAALGVDLVEGRVEALLHPKAERRGRSFQHGGLAERDGVGGDAVFGERRSGQRRGQRDGGEGAAKRKVHENLPGLRRRFAASGRCEAPVKECLTNGEKPPQRRGKSSYQLRV